MFATLLLHIVRMAKKQKKSKQPTVPRHQPIVTFYFGKFFHLQIYPTWKFEQLRVHEKLDELLHNKTLTSSSTTRKFMRWRRLPYSLATGKRKMRIKRIFNVYENYDV